MRPLESSDAPAPSATPVSDAQASEVTALLVAWCDGDRQALERLLPLVESELHLLARRYLRRERSDHSFQTSDLVQEAYLRLVDQRRARWQNRAHFFAIAARMMRRILVDHARKVRYLKRGGGAAKVPLDEACVVGEERAAELVALDDALTVLASVDERKSRVVELRYFGGLSVEETAEALGVHPDTVGREWRRAKAFLRRELARGD
jgi:RNA polymerase sigma factor (TIGR02999 family)